MEIRNFINGNFINSISKQNIRVVNPANQTDVGFIDEALEEEIDLAFDAASKAYQKRILQDMDPTRKSFYLRAIAKKLREYKSYGSQILSKENGKTLLQCEGEFEGAASVFDYYAGITDKIEYKLIPSSNDTFNYVILEPYGVSLQIIPWNYPISLFARSVAVSLVVGNTIVIKPPELCPISSNIFGKIFEEIELPPGLVNIVHGYGENTGKKLVKHKKVNQIVFTGSTEVASEIIRETADRIIPCHLELGGKSAAIIFPDANIDQAVESTINGVFKPNAGQICVAMSRVIIHPDVKNEYLKKLINKTENLKIGPGSDNNSEVTPLISKEQLKRVSNYCYSGIQSGANLAFGGNELNHKNGNYYLPTIFENVDKNSTIAQDEIFGPVVTLTPFDSEEEALLFANSTIYGLSSTIWTKDLNKANRLAQNIQAGIVWINCWLVRDLRTPFGGVKSSGVGREGGYYALNFFTEPTNVCISLN